MAVLRDAISAGSMAPREERGSVGLFRRRDQLVDRAVALVINQIQVSQSFSSNHLQCQPMKVITQ